MKEQMYNYSNINIVFGILTNINSNMLTWETLPNVVKMHWMFDVLIRLKYNIGRLPLKSWQEDFDFSPVSI